jgi:hypothetical protein
VTDRDPMSGKDAAPESLLGTPDEDASSKWDVRAFWIHLGNMTHQHPVTRLKALTDVKRDLDLLIDEAAAEAKAMRPKPATWEEIGRATGLSTSRAQSKWGRKE